MKGFGSAQFSGSAGEAVISKWWRFSLIFASQDDLELSIMGVKTELSATKSNLLELISGRKINKNYLESARRVKER